MVPLPTGQRVPRRGRTAVVLAVLLALAGCGSTSSDFVSDVGAFGVGAAVGSATGNPFLGVAAGLGTRIAAEEAYEYGERQFYRASQLAIAESGGAAAPGEVVPWAFEGPFALADSAGRVEVVRAYGERLRCKEVIFTVEPPPGPPPETAYRVVMPGEPVPPRRPPVDPDSPLPPDSEVYTTSICRWPEGWRWAGTRPNTARWGGLQ